MSELEMMSELRELTITNLENVKSKEKASKAQLNLKKHLLRIELKWGHGFNNKEVEIASSLMKTLQICYYMAIWAILLLFVVTPN